MGCLIVIIIININMAIIFIDHAVYLCAYVNWVSSSFLPSFFCLPPTTHTADYNGVSSNGSPPSHRNSPGAFYNSNSKSNRQLSHYLQSSVVTIMGLVYARYQQHNLGYPITGMMVSSWR